FRDGFRVADSNFREIDSKLEANKYRQKKSVSERFTSMTSLYKHPDARASTCTQWFLQS
ncbi:hypothetical protein MKW98_020331, partial [Papaver atlanticum]